MVLSNRDVICYYYYMQEDRTYCKHCKVKGQPLIISSRHRRKSDGVSVIQKICRPCNRAYRNSYYSRNTERCRKILRKSIARNGDKQSARLKLNYAVKVGMIVKPSKCSVCDMPHLRINAHHEDYSKPLEVKWLCSGCHAVLHKAA